MTYHFFSATSTIYPIRLKYNLTTLDNIESAPQIAKEKITEKTITKADRFNNSERGVHLTLSLSSVTDSFIKFIIDIIFICARVERLELPTPGFGDQCSTN